MELLLVFGWSSQVAFGSGIGKLIGDKLKLWDRDLSRDHSQAPVGTP